MTCAKIRIFFTANLQTLRKAQDGVAAIEFALVFPIILTIFYGVAEILNYNLQQRRGKMAIDYGVEFMSRDDDNVMTGIERMNALDIWAIVNPTANAASDTSTNNRRARGYSRSFADVEFTPTPAGCSGSACTYEPNVIWTFYWYGRAETEKPVQIQCELDVVANDMTLDGRRIPEGVLGRSALVMGHYTFRYKPLLKHRFMEAHDVSVHAIRKTRGATALQHNWNRC